MKTMFFRALTVAVVIMSAYAASAGERDNDRVQVNVKFDYPQKFTDFRDVNSALHAGRKQLMDDLRRFMDDEA